MSTPNDMMVNEWGHPCGPVTRPRAFVTGGAAPLTSHVDQRVDNSVNRPLPWIVFSWFLSGGAILGIIILCLIGPGLIDSRVEARVARAEALAELARKEASIAKDMMDVERAKRMAREEIKK